MEKEKANTGRSGAKAALLAPLDPCQVAAWRAMTPSRRVELAFQAYQFALEVVRLTERKNHPGLPPEEIAWRVTRRMQGNQRLGM
jgi:hypothetical protein